MKSQLLLVGLSITALLAFPLGKFISKVYADKQPSSEPLFI